MVSEAVPSDLVSEISTPGIIGRPSRLSSVHGPLSPTSEPASGPNLPSSNTSDVQKEIEPRQILTRASTDIPLRLGDDSKSGTESDKSTTTPGSKPNPGVWSSSWRSAATGATQSPGTDNKGSSTYLRHNAPRPMKVLRPNKSMANVTRISSNPSTPTTTNGPDLGSTRTDQQENNNSSQAVPPVTKTNPIGSGSAFGWLNSSAGRKMTANGGS